MAFHFACPITCRRICDCELGFPAGLRERGERGEFLEEIWGLEEFLQDPWSVRAEGGGATVQVEVPRVVPSPAVAGDLGADEEDAVAASSAHLKAVNASSLAAEDYIRRLESAGAAQIQGLETREDRGSSIVKIMCLICFSGEMEGSDRAIKMLSCKICSKKYHRSCLRSWAENRDLFRWNSWACPSCRSCEVCRRAGDPNKLMYCKRCDAAYHCYCQQPPHKNVNHGPYLCPKHTRCHSCGSSVPGSGHSTRWFLGYTCCDACGRLFVKGNYCPVCLKVYRDSETTPMVCCDVCERWVHCNCDGISDERYQQFQADHNLHYKCAACRGDCYQVKDIDDAVRELWKRRDESDRNQIASLSAAAGLPLEDISSFSPYSDGEQGGPVILKNSIGRTVKFSVKGLSDKSTSNSKNSKLIVPNKKYVKDKGYQIKFVHKREDQHPNFEGQREARSLESSFRDHKIDDQDLNTKVQIKGSKIQGLHIKGCAGKTETKSENMKGTKLVFHLGAKNRNSSSSPKSETSGCHREQDIVASYATISGKSDRGRSSKHGDEEKDILKIGKATDMRIKSNGKIAEECELPTISTSIPITEKRTRIGPSDLKPLLKLKFKNPYFEQQSWASRGEEENPVKGQRSKRKRPLLEVGFRENETQKNPADEAMDAKILQKLGKDAIGKRVEVHQPSDNSWHHGVVSSIVQGSSSSLTVRLDDGRSSILELGKQGVRFGTQKRKRAHT